MILLYVLASLLIILLLYVLILGICALFVDSSKEYNTHSTFYRWLLNGATAWGLRFARVKVCVTGMEKIPKNARVLFVGNHRSKFDPIVTWYIFRAWEPAFLSKEENFHVPVFGRIIRKCCFMAIDRENPREALKTIYKAAELIANDQVSIGVYPEGTRSKNNELLPFHNGVLKIAQRAKAPIIVIAIDGTEKIAKNYPLYKTKVYLDVADVIPVEEVCTAQSRELGERIRYRLETKLQNRKDVEIK